MGANYIHQHYVDTNTSAWPPANNGDYSTTYNDPAINEAPLTAGDPYSLFSYSGLNVPAPLDAYQRANYTNQSTANQEYGSHDGWWINSADSGNDCENAICNSYHILYLGANDEFGPKSFPFAANFVNSRLLMESNLHIQNVSTPNDPTHGSGKAYATIEPYFMDQTTGQIIDTMVNTWTGPYGFPDGSGDGFPNALPSGEYGREFQPLPGHKGFYNVTYQRAGTTFAEQAAGAATCFRCTGFDGGFQARITYQNLKNQIAWDNAAIDRADPGVCDASGCMTHYSTKAADYFLIYLIDGGETSTGNMTFGGNTTSPVTYTYGD